jgi:subtilisin family serine protease
VTSEGVALVGADRAHARGITGDGVVVGVIDHDFDQTSPEVAGNVAGYRDFTGGGDGLGEKSDHATMVAEIILDVAPDAQLYVANSDNDVQFAASVEWLLEQDVDIIASSQGHVGPGDGTGIKAEAFDRAAAAGVVPVIITGNNANGHWEGPFRDTDGDGAHEFPGGEEIVALNGGEPFDHDVLLTVTWDDWPQTDQDFAIDLFVENADGSFEYVGSLLIEEPPSPFEGEWIRGANEENGLYMSVRRLSGTGPLTIDVVTYDIDFEGSMPAGSIDPAATGFSSISVGAYDYRMGALEPYSGRGPTWDGRLGVDVIAPTGVSAASQGPFEASGTSAAGPHVAGVAALVLSANGSVSPAEVEAIVQETAVDAGAAGPDPDTGYGYVDAYAAVQVALGETPASDRAPPSSRAPTGEWASIATDDDEPDIPVDIAAVDVQSDDETLYVRYSYHGDFDADTLAVSTLYLNADGDFATGDPPLGADHSVAAGPHFFDVSTYDAGRGAYLEQSTPATFYEQSFATDTLTVGVPLAALGDPDAAIVAVFHRYLTPGGDVSLEVVPESGPVLLTLDTPSAGDRFEDNDDPASAPTLAAGTYPDLTAGPNDPDYYAVGLAAGQQVAVTLTFSHAEADLDVGLLDAAGNLIALSDSASDDEQFAYTAPAAGTYYVLVESFDGGTANYTLDVAFPTAVADDRFEDNDDPANATAVSTGTYADLVVQGADRDVYRFDLRAGELVNVSAAFSHAEADVDLVLFEPTGAVVAVGDSTTDDEAVGHAARRTGAYFLLVGSADGGTANYSLEVAVTDSTVPLDRFEPNDGFGDVPVVSPGTYDTLTHHRSDEDVFAVEAAAGDVLAARVTPDGAGDLALSVLAPDGSPLAFSSSPAPVESAGVVVPADGTFVLVVGSLDPLAESTYSLEVLAGPPPADDRFEDNDGLADAPTLEPGTYSDLLLVTGEDDVFAVAAETDETVTATIRFAHADGDLDLLLVDGSGTVVAASDSVTDDETASHAVAAAGTVYVVVTAPTRSGAPPTNYTLVVAVENATGAGEEPGPPFSEAIPGNPGVPTDPDGDGRFDDVNGDGQVTFADVIAMAFVDWRSLTPAQAAALDFDGNGQVDFADVIELAFM